METFDRENPVPLVEIEEEDLFARDVDGQLVRLEPETAESYNKDITLKIDGHEVTVKKAVPLTDSQGHIVRDAEGQTIPRATTIYDAANAIFVKEPGDLNPIPTLCHLQHMQPAGVCRVCVVEVFRTIGTARRPAGKLVPACHHRVEQGMEVQTFESRNDPQAGARVRMAVQVLGELLIADHLDQRQATQARPGNELAELAQRLKLDSSRFPSRQKGIEPDLSSFQIKVDHEACILCDRCVRACDEIKENDVIGRSGKGYETAIGFGYGRPMRDSGCVSCGECAVSCPTNALTFTDEFIQNQKQRLEEELKHEERDKATASRKSGNPVSGGEVVELLTADELLQLPLFGGIPYKFFQFNGGAVVRRRLKAGDVLCREGEYGKTAFIIEVGEFEVFLATQMNRVHNEPAKGIWGRLGYLTSSLVGGDPKKRTRIRSDGGATLSPGERMILTPDDLILGEMTCMNRYPRSATVVALKDSQILEIRRNVLFMLQRNPVSREIFDRVYRERVLQNQLRDLSVFEGLAAEDVEECSAFLKDRIELVRVEPGQVIFRQGETAKDFYLVRLGFVKVTQQYGADERVRNYLGPGSYFGEIGLLSRVFPEFDSGGLVGKRSATCAALDDVELVRIRNQDFRALIERYPALRDKLVQRAQELIGRDRDAQHEWAEQSRDFLAQGLYGAKSLLVLDLESCTRCDECTRACADTHDGVTRLIREGLRFDKFLVASSCRSCMDPYCMVGCPVDAIHREGSLEIVIEDHCIGCGLCAENCPYGNINMHGFREMRTDPGSGRQIAVVQQKATTCDLCRNVRGQEPSCVYACPHNSAFRMSGPELLQLVGGE